ncbi:unnamed protein product [Clavelina lepadiformis]|uniref:Uncharacterized protein n=1 Tax=Clavelina lepadiformis TaxID=159417 RepID=A0ABP0G0X4_CLALP
MYSDKNMVKGCDCKNTVSKLPPNSVSSTPDKKLKVTRQGLMLEDKLSLLDTYCTKLKNDSQLGAAIMLGISHGLLQKMLKKVEEISNEVSAGDGYSIRHKTGKDKQIKYILYDLLQFVKARCKPVKAEQLAKEGG